MNLALLIAYGVINLAMIARSLRKGGDYYQFPFWIGTIALGFFFTQAVGGYLTGAAFPGNAYAMGMLFASLCTLAVWAGFSHANSKAVNRGSWLSAEFDIRKLYYAGAFLTIFGFYFQWKLWSLPEEMLMKGVWSGATVKYNFLASVFKLGFITHWLIYLHEKKPFNMRLLVFLVPCFLLLLSAAILRGRRAEMMNLCSYTLVSLWFVRGYKIHRWILITSICGGLILVNGIEQYRLIMLDHQSSLSERVSEVSRVDYLAASRKSLENSNVEFRNYIYYRYVCDMHGIYDFGMWHWNMLVKDYVPAQVFGKEFKDDLLYRPDLFWEVGHFAKKEHGHVRAPTSTPTGYVDAFRSFGWFGVVKFWLIGWIMGRLYRHGFEGHFLGQLLYIYLLSDAMHAVTHHTNLILGSCWIYFFFMAYPFFYLAISHPGRSSESPA